eukprot:gene15034-4478_t
MEIDEYRMDHNMQDKKFAKELAQQAFGARESLLKDRVNDLTKQVENSDALNRLSRKMDSLEEVIDTRKRDIHDQERRTMQKRLQVCLYRPPLVTSPTGTLRTYCEKVRT